MDLSRVMFITTANTLVHPPSLLDRMEVIEASPQLCRRGEVADRKRHLLPKQLGTV